MARSIEPYDIDDDQVLTQFGAKQDIVALDPPFRRKPRQGRETNVSLILGRLSPAEASRIVRRSLAPAPFDGVRYATAGKLRAAGFVVMHTPSRMNPNHVSVSRTTEWGANEESAFDECFDEPVWIGEEEVPGE